MKRCKHSLEREGLEPGAIKRLEKGSKLNDNREIQSIKKIDTHRLPIK